MTLASLTLWYSLASDYFLIPLQFIIFFLGLITLFKVYYIVTRENKFILTLNRMTLEHVDREFDGGENRDFAETVWFIFQRALEKQLHQNYKSIEELPHLDQIVTPIEAQNPNDSDQEDSVVWSSQDTQEPQSFKAFIGHKIDRLFNIQKGYQTIIENTLKQVVYHKFGQPTPDFSKIATYALTYNEYFTKIWKGMNMESTLNVIKSLHEIIVMLGILGTFTGFYISFASGAGIESGVSLAIISSIVGMTLGISFMLIVQFLDTEDVAINTEATFQDSLELLWNNSQFTEKHPPEFLTTLDPNQYIKIADPKILRNITECMLIVGSIDDLSRKEVNAIFESIRLISNIPFDELNTIMQSILQEIELQKRHQQRTLRRFHKICEELVSSCSSQEKNLIWQMVRQLTRTDGTMSPQERILLSIFEREFLAGFSSIKNAK